MECNEIKKNMDDYLDGYLNNDHHATVKHHINTCRGCSSAYQDEIIFRRSLRNLDAQLPAKEFTENVFTDVVATHRWKQRKKAFFAMGSALAASIAIWILTSTTGILPGKSGIIPDITMTLNEVKYVNLVLNSPSGLDDAKLTLKVPGNIRIVGYQDIKELSWTTKIQKGKNYLTLPLRAVEAGKTVLEAKVEHQDKSKTHTFNLLINENLTIEGRVDFNFKV